jgi:hypothetical protein
VILNPGCEQSCVLGIDIDIDIDDIETDRRETGLTGAASWIAVRRSRIEILKDFNKAVAGTQQCRAYRVS